MRARIPVLATVFFLFGAGALAAQAWDSPGFLPPTADDRFGVYLLLPEGADFGVVGTFRQAGRLNLGVRGGLAKPEGGSTRVFIGSDMWGMLVRQGSESPFDVAWTVGAGAAFGNGTLARFPAGVSIGREFGAAGVALVPYVHPRLTYQIFANDGRSDSDLRIGADLGLDLRLGGRMILRGAVALDQDVSTVGLGVAWRAPNGAAVR
ncbi:MAG TPA: hypothetical protein VKZ58_10830 [Longimicrobiales bacterium]|nr:hypothetical protein [Longimicrobiales bacterium]